MTKEQEIMNFLETRVFDPVLDSLTASRGLKAGINLSKTRLNRRNAIGMVGFFWSIINGTERSTRFAKMLRDEGFTRFEDVKDEFREKFNDEWLSK